jgi:formate-dependent nitrite reductase membrane component NrfD
MPSTFFTASPHWRWLIVAYFFCGGIAGGSYFLATVLDLFRQDRRLVQLGYLVAFPTVVLCGAVLTIDLGRPERFWHMLIQSETLHPMLKTYSPMSLGAWALLSFSACAFVSFVAVLGERGWLRWSVIRGLSPTGLVGRAVTVVGTVLGLYLAGYTGVLLSVTNRPIWADTTLLGITFLVSAASTSAALLVVLGAWRGVSREGLEMLERFDGRVLVLELVVIVALIVSLGRIAMVGVSGWGVLLAVMLLGGIVVPLVLQARSTAHGSLGPALVLLGGLVFRFVIVFSSDRL